MSIESEHLFDQPAPDPDRLAEYQADIAYKSGRWLERSVEAGLPQTTTAEIMLGGRYDDRALTEVGLDGRVLAEATDPLNGTDAYSSLGHWLSSEESPGDKLRTELERRQQFHRSPVVREAARLLSKEPIEVEPNPENVIWYFTGSKVLDPDGNEMTALINRDFRQAWMSLIVPEGKRLVIDNIAKGDKTDPFPYTDDNPLLRAQVQVYHNSEGYLVADKVLGGQISKKHVVTIKPSNAAPRAVSIDQDAPEQRAMDSLWPSNDRKQEFVDPLYPDNKSIRLVTTTSTWVLGKGLYDTMEVEVHTPDDTGNNVDIAFDLTENLPDEYGPIAVRLIDDTSNNIAHNNYQ